MKLAKANFRRQYLYVIPSQTPHGFKYNIYSNERPEFGEYRVNLLKYGRK